MMRAYRVLTEANLPELAAATGMPEKEMKEMLKQADNFYSYYIFWRELMTWKWVRVSNTISAEVVVDQIGYARG